MTREEEIELVCKEKYPSSALFEQYINSLREGFYEGAMWSDDNPIKENQSRVIMRIKEIDPEEK